MPMIRLYNRNGLRVASNGPYKVIAYAEGGYCTLRYVAWIGFVLDDNIPPDAEKALCAALRIPCLEV